MNDLGQVVGYTGNDEPVGVEAPTLTWVWSPATGITFPGIEGHPSAVNNAGQIVIAGGSRWTPGVVARATGRAAEQHQRQQRPGSSPESLQPTR